MPRGIAKSGSRNYNGTWRNDNPFRGKRPLFGDGAPSKDEVIAECLKKGINIPPEFAEGSNVVQLRTGIDQALVDNTPIRMPTIGVPFGEEWGWPDTRELTPDELISDEELGKKIRARFKIFTELAEEMTEPDGTRALIVSGSPGVGKSYELERILKEYDPVGNKTDFTKGYTRPAGMYRSLWKRRQPGDIQVWDDADDVFKEKAGLNILKIAADTLQTRRISWDVAVMKIMDEDGEPLPTEFQFDGGLIFITNQDFDKMISAASVMADHYKALQSRSNYIDLAIHTRRAVMIRIKQVIEETDMLQSFLSDKQIDEVIQYLNEHRNDCRELSLRTALKLGKRIKKGNWVPWAEATLLREKLGH